MSISVVFSDPGFGGTPEAATAGHCYRNSLLQTLLCQVRKRYQHNTVILDILKSEIRIHLIWDFGYNNVAAVITLPE